MSDSKEHTITISFDLKVQDTSDKLAEARALLIVRQTLQARGIAWTDLVARPAYPKAK
jgi:hypothetical protein